MTKKPEFKNHYLASEYFIKVLNDKVNTLQRRMKTVQFSETYSLTDIDKIRETMREIDDTIATLRFNVIEFLQRKT